MIMYVDPYMTWMQDSYYVGSRMGHLGDLSLLKLYFCLLAMRYILYFLFLCQLGCCVGRLCSTFAFSPPALPFLLCAPFLAGWLPCKGCVGGFFALAGRCLLSVVLLVGSGLLGGCLVAAGLHWAQLM